MAVVYMVNKQTKKKKIAEVKSDSRLQILKPMSFPVYFNAPPSTQRTRWPHFLNRLDTLTQQGFGRVQDSLTLTQAPGDP